MTDIENKIETEQGRTAQESSEEIQKTKDVLEGEDKIADDNTSSSLKKDEEIPETSLINSDSSMMESELLKNEVNQRLDLIVQELSNLNRLFDVKIKQSDHEAKIIDSMHGELQEYKSDLYSKILKPVLMDIIDIRDSIIRMKIAYLQKPEGEQAIPNEVFAGYALDLQDLLERYGVEVYKGDTCTQYVPIKQKVLKKIDTSDEKLNGTVAESMSYGYMYNDKVLVPEKISLYCYKKPESDDKKD